MHNSKQKKLAALLTNELEQYQAFLPSSNPTTTDDSQKISEQFFALVTMRNRNLITREEQELLKQQHVAFYGMSVGSHAAVTWALEVRPTYMVLADYDVISPSNLNRLRFGWESIGKRKVDVVAEQIASINPFGSMLLDRECSIESIETTLSAAAPLAAIVDETDTISGKLFLRMKARELQVPLVSVADVGDAVMIDVERHDTERDYPFFHGRLGAVTMESLKNLEPLELKKLIIKLVGTDHNSERLLESLLAIGDTLPTWPQLGSIASLSGGVATVTLRKILLGEKILSGRYFISLDEIMVADYFSQSRVKKRSSLTEVLHQLLSR